MSLCIIIIQNLLSTLINIVDTIMVGGLGEISVASIGIANQYFFLYNMALSGIVGGSGLFIAQFYSKKDKVETKVGNVIVGCKTSFPMMSMSIPPRYLRWMRSESFCSLLSLISLAKDMLR